MRLWLLLVLLAFPALAAPEGEQLEQVQTQLERAQSKQQQLNEQAQALGHELAELRRKLIAATSAADASDAQLQELESNLADLEGAAQRRQAQLAQQRQQLAQTLALLQRLSLTPSAAQLLSPTPPLDRLRTDLQLKALLPEIQARAAEVASTVNDLNALRRQLEQQRRKVVSERNRALQQSRALDTLIAERDQKLSGTRAQSHEAQQRAITLSGQAQNLRELIDRLEAEPDDPPIPAALPLPAGAARQLPVSAPVVVRFGGRDSYGSVSKGIVLRPRPSARVAAVASGRVAFAGPFRGYGRVLILSHSGGFHTVIAGIAQTSVSVGDSVQAGEPLGQMAESNDPPPELYFEVRFEGSPIDPLSAKARSLTTRR